MDAVRLAQPILLGVVFVVTVLRNVVLAGLCRVMMRMRGVAMGRMRMMCRGVVLTFLVMLRGFAVMPGRMFMMFGRAMMMFGGRM